jgi:hypothetical protein
VSFKLLKQNVYNVSNQKSSRHDVEYEESNGLANENYLPLCFSSFELLKVNHEIIEEAVKSDCIHSDIVLHEKIIISEEDQQPSHTFNDPVVDYMEGYFSSDLQPVINYHLGNKYDGQSTSVLDMDCLPLGFHFNQHCLLIQKIVISSKDVCRAEDVVTGSISKEDVVVA